MLENAIELASKGLCVFPLAPKSKVPIKGLIGGVHTATTDLSTIKDWWTKNPEANVGVAMGEKSGIFGLDIDYNHGAERDFRKRLPLTVTTRSANGHHAYFKWPKGGVKSHFIQRNNTGKECVYARAEGYYFVFPPSIHPTGVPYEYEKFERTNDYDGPGADLLSPFEVAFAEAPALLLSMGAEETPTPFFIPNKSKRKGIETTTCGIKYGPNERHQMFKDTATAMRAAGRTFDEILTRLIQRNIHDCSPPKTEAEGISAELASVAQWAIENVKVQERESFEGAYVRALGHEGSTYYYSSSSNKQIVSLSCSGHTINGLLDLMPKDYWLSKYPLGDKGVKIDINSAASDLMEQCRGEGIYDDGRVRGRGPWLHDNGLVLHLGNRTWFQGEYHELNNIISQSVYRLSPMLPNLLEPMAATESKLLEQACRVFSWDRPSSHMYLTGFLAIMRIGGALNWRPHLWITGGAGAGKSTLLTDIVAPMAGNKWAIYPQSETTAAGIRQELADNSLPVVFDEAESDSQAGRKRMGAIMELIRQSSSMTAGKIMKGTADGQGTSFKVNSCFILSSVKTCLEKETDRSRFTVLELNNRHAGDYSEIRKLSCLINEEFGDRAFSRMVHSFDRLIRNIEVMRRVIAPELTARGAQQFGALLGGYYTFIEDGELTDERAKELYLKAEAKEIREYGRQDAEEMECWNYLRQSIISYQDTAGIHSETIGTLMNMASSDEKVCRILEDRGILGTGSTIFISNTNPQLEKIFSNSKWDQKRWSQILKRLPGAEEKRRRLSRVLNYCVSLPVSLIRDNGELPEQST